VFLVFFFHGRGFALEGMYVYIAMSRRSVARARCFFTYKYNSDSYYSLSAKAHLFLIFTTAPSHLYSVYISSRSCYARCSHLEFDRALNTELSKFTLSHVQIKTSDWSQ
jgi:hypothetical protein